MAKVLIINNVPIANNANVVLIMLSPYKKFGKVYTPMISFWLHGCKVFFMSYIYIRILTMARWEFGHI
jgi:hypothetical protein